MKRFNTMIYGLSLALIGAGLASATPILTPGLTVTSGPATFSHFGCTFSNAGMTSGACSQVDVAAAPVPTGLVFSALDLSTRGISSVDESLFFDVSSTAPISAIGLSFNSSYFGLNVNSVTEDVYTSAAMTDLVGTVTVWCSNITGCSSTTTASIALTGGSYSSLYVDKDIILSGYATTDLGELSIIGQTFTTTSTPEPVTMSLIGGGLALMGLVRLRRNKSKS